MPHLCYAKKPLGRTRRRQTRRSCHRHRLRRQCRVRTRYPSPARVLPIWFYPYMGRFVGFAWEVLPSRREETRFRPSSTTEHVLCHGLLTGKGSVNYLAVAGQCFPQCKTSRLYRFAGALTKLCKTHEQTSSGPLATGSAFRVKSNIFVSTGLTLCLEDGLYGCGCTNTIGTLFT